MLPALQALPVDTGDDIHIVASGDPLMHGIGGTLIRLFGAEKVRVLPHVSAVTLACARMGWNVHDTEVISLVTARPHTAVRRGGQAIVLSSDRSTPEGAGGAAERPRPRRFRVQRARTTRRASRTPPRRHGAPVGRRRTPGCRRSQRDRRPLPARRAHVAAARRCVRPRRADHQIRNPGGDFGGAGSRGQGSGYGTSARARAASRSSGACVGGAAARWRSNATSDAASTSRPTPRPPAWKSTCAAKPPTRSTAPQPPSVIFIGGGLTQPGLLDACLDNLPTGGRLVANTVTTESEAVLMRAYSRLGGQLRRFQHYQGEPLGGFTGWRPQYPVTQWAVTKP